MTDSFSGTQIKQLKQIVAEVVDKVVEKKLDAKLSHYPTNDDLNKTLDAKLSHYPTNAEFGQILERTFEDKLGEDFKERLNRIEDNTDRACKIAKDTREEQVLTQAKVDRHDAEIKALQAFTGFATT